ncbi:polysaccharide biosynthesis tyrosine autokinase [Frondihabitans australicus]|uniref:Capsular exopolysaccharide synthesis family protein n=1 Tax=Frondihabitans australicus TaxID=386892 RepID=A0A495IL13_9MICO|nr:polysaccharide biosynthesis tyrosine autokinase [Frondihabitans australicus]RKR76128.1 capsular exopolysaccharide synthesis family protein [Frondihabitans australicus]
MDIARLLRLLRGGWVVLALGVAAGLGAGYGMTSLAAPQYTATAELYVTVGGGNTAIDLLQGGSAAEQKVQSYVSVATSTRVLQPVIDELHLKTTPADLASRVTASTPVQTVLIDIRVEDLDPVLSAQIANAISKQLAAVVTQQLEPSSGAASTPVGLSVVTPATTPTAPTSPRPLLNIGAGGMVGLMLGVGVLALRSAIDTKLRDRDDVASAAKSPILGEMAFDRSAVTKPLVIQTDPRSPRAEAFRRLRTNLQFLDIGSESRSFVVTSALPREGKSTTATNLAITLAESGARVALVDADLRRPRVATLMGIEGGAGLTDVLAGRAELVDVLQPWGLGSLSVLPAGQIPPNPTELLGSPSMALVLRELSESFEFVILDAPPLLPVTDAAILANATNGALLVTAMNRTTHRQLSSAVATLDAAGAPRLGLILTMTKAKKLDAYAYAYSPETLEMSAVAAPAEKRVPRRAKADGR